MIKQLILLKIQNIMDTKVELLQWFTNFLIKSLLELILQVILLSLQINLLLKVKWIQAHNYQKNYTNQLLENLKNKNYSHLLEKIFGMSILRICSLYVNLIKEFVFFNVLLMFIVNMHGLFLWNTKKVLEELMLFKKTEMSPITN